MPPTPVATRRAVSGSSMVTKTDPRPVQRGLGAFGFASNRKVQDQRSVTAPSSASVFSRARGGQGKRREEEEDVDMQAESPIKAVQTLRRAASAKGFRPLFASPGGNHTPQDVLGVPPTAARIGARSMSQEEDDAEAVMEDDSSSPVGGLFAAQVAQRRRARESESPVSETTGAEAMKKHKVRAAVQLPSSSDLDDDEEADAVESRAYASSSPPFYRRMGAGSSSPHTELTEPSSTARPSTDRAFASKHRTAAVQPSSSPSRAIDMASDSEAKAVHNDAAVDSWRKIQQVELSDEDEPSAKGGSKCKKVISITPYQRYGSVRTSLPSTPADEDEAEFSLYRLPTSTLARGGVYAVDAISNAPSDDDADDNATHASLAGLRLSPVRHAPSTRASRAQRHRLLTSIFDPTAKRQCKPSLNPEARFGPLQPSATSSPDSDDDSDLHPSAHAKTTSLATTNPVVDDDDDDDWQQEVDQDFTFLDSEIELQDVA